MSEQGSSTDRIRAAADRLGIEAEAFYFVLDVLHHFALHLVLREGTTRPINASELSHRLCEVAVSEFGPKAVEQLRAWHVETTIDLGNIVYALVEIDLAHAHQDDSIEDFRDLFDLEDALSQILQQRQRQRAAPAGKFHQYRLSSMLLVTTILAFVFAGYAREKFVGSVIAVYFAWLTAIALVCWWATFRDRQTAWLPGAVVGTLFFAAAAVVFRVLFVP